MIIPRPKFYRLLGMKSVQLKPGYGERRRKREAAKIPLLASLPGMLPSATEIETRMLTMLQGEARRHRHERAELWRELRRELRTLNAVEQAEWLRVWGYLPHDPGYGLGAIHSMRQDGYWERRRADEDKRRRWVEERA